MRLGTVGEHGPNLARTDTGARGFEDDMTAIGRPTGALVAALIAGQFNDLPGGGVHDVNVVVVVRATPTEGQQLAVGRPGGVDDVALFGKVKFRRTGTVGIHQVELRSAATVADERDGLAGLGVPSGRHARAIGMGKALGAAAVEVADVKLGGSLHRRGKNNLSAVGRPSGRDVGASETGERDELPGI